jgi:ABC-type bacteriocin/lantibiotic exporter with double-glycine peptidase domain
MPMHLLSVEHHIQEQKAGCLAACAYMVLLYRNQVHSQQSLNLLFGTTSIGAPLSRIKRLERHEFQVVLEFGDETSLRTAIDQNIPPIAFVRTNQFSYWSTDVQHAVVVIGYDEANFFVNDPAFAQAPQQIEINEFMLAWDEFDYQYALISIR